jgi:hypothetical protein
MVLDPSTGSGSVLSYIEGRLCSNNNFVGVSLKAAKLYSSSKAVA